MRAWAVIEPEQPLQQVEAPTPQPEGTQVLVEVTHCGVRHSDLHFWEGVLDLGAPEKTPISAIGLEPIPVERRPKSEATRTLKDLRDGRITGRVVLEG